MPRRYWLYSRHFAKTCNESKGELTLQRPTGLPEPVHNQALTHQGVPWCTAIKQHTVQVKIDTRLAVANCSYVVYLSQTDLRAMYMKLQEATVPEKRGVDQFGKPLEHEPEQLSLFRKLWGHE